MKRVLLILAITAMIVSSCGTKTNAQKEEVETEVRVTDKAQMEKGCCSKTNEAYCKKDSTAYKKECTEKKTCTKSKECTGKSKDS